MDYEKKYKEALEIARQFSEHPLQEDSSTIVEYIFPELQESEDEMIRKILVEAVTQVLQDQYCSNRGVSKEKVVAWLENQAEQKDNNKLIWKHWSGCGIAGNGDCTQIYLIKQYNTYSVCSCLSSECDYILLSDLDKLISDGDVDVRYKYLEDILAADDIYQMSMNDTMVEEAKSKASEALSKMSIGKLLGIKNQDEQKPINKIEPKFHEGDWVVCEAGELTSTLQITGIKNGCYWFHDDTYLPVVDEDCLHLWTIGDARDGDVLASDNSIFIFSQEYIVGKPEAHCGIMNGLSIAKSEGCWTNEECYPATKEQRDLLFQKMKEAGFEWDSEKKELKKISQRMISAEAKEAMYDKPTDNDMVEALRTEYEKGRADVLRCIDPDEMVADFCSQPLSKTRSIASVYRQGIIDIIKRINRNEETSITSTRSIDDGGVR